MTDKTSSQTLGDIIVQKSLLLWEARNDNKNLLKKKYWLDKSTTVVTSSHEETASKWMRPGWRLHLGAQGSDHVKDLNVRGPSPTCLALYQLGHAIFIFVYMNVVIINNWCMLWCGVFVILFWNRDLVVILITRNLVKNDSWNFIIKILIYYSCIKNIGYNENMKNSTL